MKTGERIKSRRKAIGMSAETLAQRIGKSPATVYRYEKGDIDKVDSRVIPMIADALSVEPKYLMGWDESSPSVVPQPDPTEQELVSIYRDLNDTGRTALMGTARGLAMNPDMKKDGGLSAVTA